MLSRRKALKVTFSIVGFIVDGLNSTYSLYFLLLFSLCILTSVHFDSYILKMSIFVFVCMKRDHFSPFIFIFKEPKWSRFKRIETNIVTFRKYRDQNGRNNLKLQSLK